VNPVTAVVSDKRFRRARVKPARKRGKWYGFTKRTAQFAALAVALAYGISRASAGAARARMLRVDRILVQGTDRLSPGDVLAILTGLQGESLLWTDLDVWRRRLLASSWVRDAALRRSLPSTVEVLISERQPIGIGRISGDMYLVDDRGVIIDQYGPQHAQFDLPIIDGLSASPGEGGTMTDAARADLAARVIASIKSKPVIARRVSQIDVTDEHNARVILTGDPAVIQLGDDQFLARIESYTQLASALRERVSEIDYVDLRFGDRIYVRPVTPIKPAAAIPRRRD
jgi:cell division septal protein FtsQ